MNAFLLLPLLITSRTATLASCHVDDGHSNGLVFPLRNGFLRISQIAIDAIRVQYSLTKQFPPQRVPTLVSNGALPGLPIFRQGGVTMVPVGQLVAVIDQGRETVRFLDRKGKELLAEEPGSRFLTPVVLPGPTPVNTFKAVQGFDLRPGEAVYGLGQHQDGLMDYRGRVVDLEQQNREIAIPFAITSGGAGLLWNNPSHTTVNVATSVTSLPASQLLDEDGKPGGLTGRYFRGEHFEHLVGKSVDSNIDFLWTTDPPSGLPRNNYSARWDGFIEAKKAGSYRFSTLSDDGVRLWIDNKLVIDNWTIHPAAVNVGRVNFPSNSRHRIRVEYFQAGGDAVIRLKCAVENPTNTLQWSSEAADGIDYCVFYGPSVDKIMSSYRHATGEAPMPPKTALGYWQSKERYSTQKEWIDIAAEYRRRQHPIDNLVQDWFYWDPAPWGSHKFDPKRYPDPAASIDELHRKYHLQFMISVWGKFAPGSAENSNGNLTTMDSKGFLFPGLGGSNERYYDAFNPDARRLYWELMRDQIFKFGVDAWWLDASEPEVSMSDFRSTPTAAGLGAQVLNGWPLMHTAGVSNGQLEASPNKRVFILTRSAYAGQQRTGAACWSGDITATWDVFANQIPAGLNFCLSGIPYWTTDIGAFFLPGGAYPKKASDPGYRELFTRWFQYGSFCPIFRVHGTDLAKEMWRFGPATEKILNHYDELRYRLMPYIYSQAWQVSAHGGTLMRALVMDFPQDRVARESKDEFMFGTSMLICPVITKGAKARQVYLPSGTSWTDFWTGKAYAGGTSILANAPIEKMPIFVKAGAILPVGPLMQYVDEKPADPIELRLYPGVNGSFTLYEDEGMNNNYKHGMQAFIPISWNDKRRTLTFGQRKGAFPGMLPTRTFHLVVGSPGIAESSSGDRGVALVYSGSKVRVKFPKR